MPEWIRSSHCQWSSEGCNCVDVAFIQDGTVLVRNSANPAATVSFSDAEWDAFLAGCVAGEFDRPT